MIEAVLDAPGLTRPAFCLATSQIMPEISHFFGIVIGIFPREHPPAHFHAVYGDYQVTVDIASGEVTGEFPRRALRLVEEWRKLHQTELLENWNMLQAGRPASKIDPLE